MNKVALSHRPSCVYSSAGRTNGSAAIAENINEIWLVQEWCDMGTLESAISGGKFRMSNGEVDLVSGAKLDKSVLDKLNADELLL